MAAVFCPNKINNAEEELCWERNGFNSLGKRVKIVPRVGRRENLVGMPKIQSVQWYIDYRDWKKRAKN